MKNKSFVQTSTILYSLFIVSSISFSLHSQDTNTQDDEELILVFDDGNDNLEEIYPLEDIDTACLLPEIQAEVETLEADQIETPEADQIETPEADQTPKADQVMDWDQSYIEDLELDPIAKSQPTEDIVESVIIDVAADLLPQDEEGTDFLEIPEDCPIAIISQDQLEEILKNDQEQLHDNEIALQSDELSTAQEIAPLAAEDTADDDDIILVPHDLINSVKKANKQKKKLEKLARKEKADSFKKSKKSNKKKS